MTTRAGTEEEVANLALGHIKQPPIALLTDENNRARAVKQFFALARDATLRLRWWNFATGREVLSAVPNMTLPGNTLKKVYPLPADCLLVRFVENSGPDEWAIEAYKQTPPDAGIEVSVLVTDLASPLIFYTRCLQNPAKWTSDFCTAMSYQLAAFAGPQLGASSSRVEQAQAKANEWREEAARVDAQEQAPKQVSKNTSWIGARRVGAARRA